MKLRSKIESEEQNITGVLAGLMRLVRAFRTFNANIVVSKKRRH